MKQYYTSSDSFVFVKAPDDIVSSQPVLLDDLQYIAFSENLTSQPVYGIGDPTFGFTSVGNIIVSGEIVLRFLDFDYLYNAIYASTESGVKKEVSELNNLRLSAAQIRKKRILREYLSDLDSSDILSIPMYFDIIISLDNSSYYNVDKTKIIYIKNVKVIAKEFMTGVPNQQQAVNIKYKFIAQKVTHGLTGIVEVGEIEQDL